MHFKKFMQKIIAIRYALWKAFHIGKLFFHRRLSGVNWIAYEVIYLALQSPEHCLPNRVFGMSCCRKSSFHFLIQKNMAAHPPLPRFTPSLTTSVSDDSPVGLDDLHVNPLLLFANHHCPPQPVVFPLLFCCIFWNRLWLLARIFVRCRILCKWSTEQCWRSKTFTVQEVQQPAVSWQSELDELPVLYNSSRASHHPDHIKDTQWSLLLTEQPTPLRRSSWGWG